MSRVSHRVHKQDGRLQVTRGGRGEGQEPHAVAALEGDAHARVRCGEVPVEIEGPSSRDQSACGEELCVDRELGEGGAGDAEAHVAETACLGVGGSRIDVSDAGRRKGARRIERTIDFDVSRRKGSVLKSRVEEVVRGAGGVDRSPRREAMRHRL